MSCADIQDIFKDQVQALKDLLAALNAAILTFTMDGTVQQYTLDTGQTRQTVIRSQLGELRLWRSRLLSELDDLEQRLCRTGSRYVSHL